MPAAWQHRYLLCCSCQPTPTLAPGIAASSRGILAKHAAAHALPSQRPVAVPGRKPVLLSKPLPREKPPAADTPAAVEAADVAQALQQAHRAPVGKADDAAVPVVSEAADSTSTSYNSQRNVDGGSITARIASSCSSTSTGRSNAASDGLMPETLWMYRPAADAAKALPQHTSGPSDVQPAERSCTDQQPTMLEQQQQQQLQHEQQNHEAQQQRQQQQQQQQQQPPSDQRQRHKQDVRLRNQLRQLREWQQWADFLQQQGSHLSATSIVYAFIHLRDLHADATASAAGLSGTLLPQLQQLNSEQAAQQQNERQPQQQGQADQAGHQQDAEQQQQQQQEQRQQQQQAFFEQTWAALVAQALAAAPQVAPVQWSQLAYTAAKLGKRDRGLMAAVATHTASQLAALKGAALVNVLWAFAALQLSPGEPWLDAHTEAASAQLPTLNCHQLVTLLWCWGRLGHRPPAATVQALLSSISRGFEAQSPSELTNTVWALARLSYVPSRTWMRRWFTASRLLLVRAAADGTSGSGSNGSSDDGSSTSSSSSISSSSNDGVHLLACMASSLAALRVAPPRLWHKAWLAAVRAHWHSLSARQLGVVLCALAKQRRALHPHWLGLVALRFGQLLPTASTADIAAVVWALPKLAYPNALRYGWRLQRRGLLAAVARATEPGLGRATPGQLVQLASGFAGLKYYPGVHWMKVHENAAAAQHEALSKVNRERLRRSYCVLWDVHR